MACPWLNFILRNITFSPEYAASVEQKQVAEQLAQQAAFVVEQRRQEAEQARQVAQGQADAVVINAQGAADARIIQAQAEAQALQLIADALKNNDKLLLYQYINQLAPGIQVMLVPNDNPYLLTLPTLTCDNYACSNPIADHSTVEYSIEISTLPNMMSQPESSPSGRQIRLTTLSSCAG